MKTPEQSEYFVAVDLGAESGRVILGELSGGRMGLEEIHRFPNVPVQVAGSKRWDVLGMFREIKAGLSKVGARGVAVKSLSVDSWGVDYCWSGAGQPLLSLPYIYRDDRIDAAMESALKVVPFEAIYRETGIQLMPFNTIFQLHADMKQSPRIVGLADHFLCIADFYHYLLAGVARAERSLASTTQLFDPRTGEWSAVLIDEFGFPPSVFPEIVDSGTVLGPLTEEAARETGLAGASVVATCSHDTGAAVAAVPAAGGDDWAYLSSGTWSLIGVELEKPLLGHAARQANFTNEAGFGGTTRFLKNIVGLWILQECRRAWEADGRAFTYAELNALAAEAEPLRCLIDPSDPRFLKPGEMPAKIESFCREHSQPVPESPGAIARCILESLALLYRVSLAQLEGLTGRTLTKLHIVGGGSQSDLLNQFAANATGRTVIAGPVEATAAGNLLIQAIAAGSLESLDALRRCSAASFDTRVFEPTDGGVWSEASARFAAFAGA